MKRIISDVYEDIGQLEFSHIVDGSRGWYNTFGKPPHLLKAKVCTPQPVILLLIIYSTGNVYVMFTKRHNTRMFIEILL